MSSTQPGTFKALIEAKERLQKEEKAKLELVSKAEPLSALTIPNVPDQTNPIKNAKTSKHSIAPEKDFAKVANSIAREAVPNRLFKGMSKNTYDALYLKTRGAINPIRSIRVTKPDLMRWAGVSDITLDRHLKHLRSVGLITVEFIIGSHEGNLYEVMIPEEVTNDPPNVPYIPNVPNVPTIVGYHVPNNVGYVGWGNLIENKELNGTPKTLLKTNTGNDDEPFGALTEILRKMSKKATGKTSAKNESEKWREFAELIEMEFDIAAARTNSISSVPAFLVEHLRRRLLSKADAPKAKASKTLQVDKSQTPQVELFVAEPLTTESREVVLKTFKEYIKKGQRDFVLSFEGTYTKDDWLFLMENLE
jgi:hypothetical protein